MLKKLILKTLGFLSIAALVSAFTLSFYIPHLAKTKALNSVQDLGLTTTTIKETESTWGSVKFSGITLDQDNFSTVETITVHYSWLNMLLKRQIEHININAPHLTGEMSKSLKLTVIGLGTLSSQISARSISIKDGQIDVLTPYIGGLSLNFDIQISAQNNPSTNRLNIKGTLGGKQKQLSFSSKFTGTYARPDQWQSEFQIEEGKFEWEKIKGTRTNGKLSVRASPVTDHAQIIGQITAGGLSYYGTQWRNVSISFDGDANQYKLLSSGKGVKAGDLEFSLSHQKQGENPEITGSLYAPTKDSMNALMQKFNFEGEDWKQHWTDENGITVNYELYFDIPESRIYKFMYYFNKNQESIDIKKEIIFNQKVPPYLFKTK